MNVEGPPVENRPAQKEIATFLSGTKPGEAKCMAFWDRTDEILALAEIDDATEIGEKMLKGFAFELVRARVSERMSAVPGYSDFHDTSTELVFAVKSEFERESAGQIAFLDYLNDTRTQLTIDSD